MNIQQIVNKSIEKDYVSFEKMTLTKEAVQYLISRSSISTVQIIAFSEIEFQKDAIAELEKGCWNSLFHLAFKAKDMKPISQYLYQFVKIINWKITTLQIIYSELDFSDCQMLTKSSWKLTQLFLSRNNVQFEGFYLLTTANWEIKSLKLDWNNINFNTKYSIKDKLWTGLTYLNLSNNQIEDKGCKFIYEANWKQLEELWIWDNRITSIGCKWLAKSQWRQLKWLVLSENPINWKGAQYLTDCEWPSVTFINFCECWLDFESVKQMLKLQSLSIVGISFFDEELISQIKCLEPFMKKGHPCFERYFCQ